ncbi:hypothetical protein [Streptomyces marincola]|uniref:Uncharacterized protein n=1 Tax=Streptomyces marincola TaxID=2878388 RepID=A0A1W7CYS5_9ACTN|nr:hypothetical protein [Streptomyces marincola]ARQ69934.1 hypothetical protein CAG99_14665 [Streptomyces marincola]
MDEDLGPFQPLWVAWDEAHQSLLNEPLLHFRRASDAQFDELEQHLAAENRDAAVREAVDMISVALNVMRWLGCDPNEIATAARERAEQRIVGQTAEILEKYSVSRER